MAAEKEMENMRNFIYWIVGGTAGSILLLFLVVGGGAFGVLSSANAELSDENAQQWRIIQKGMDKQDFVEYNKENKAEHVEIKKENKANNKELKESITSVQKEVGEVKEDVGKVNSEVGKMGVKIDNLADGMKDIKEYIKSK